MELPLSWSVKASAAWGECLNYRGGGGGGVGAPPSPAQLTPTPDPSLVKTVNSLVWSKHQDVTLIFELVDV